MSKNLKPETEKFFKNEFKEKNEKLEKDEKIEAPELPKNFFPIFQKRKDIKEDPELKVQKEIEKIKPGLANDGLSSFARTQRRAAGLAADEVGPKPVRHVDSLG